MVKEENILKKTENSLACLSDKCKRYKRCFIVDYFAFNYFHRQFVRPRNLHSFILMNDHWKNYYWKKISGTFPVSVRTCAPQFFATKPTPPPSPPPKSTQLQLKNNFSYGRQMKK